MSKPSKYRAHRDAMSWYERGLYDMGWAEAEARIIKVLEELQETYTQERYRLIGGFFRRRALEAAIELIKGETSTSYSENLVIPPDSENDVKGEIE